MPSIEILPAEILPCYMSDGASGMDLYARLSESAYLFPHHTLLIPTGIRVAIPTGYELQIRPRSGFAIAYNSIMPNAPGTIDSDYRGEIKVALRNIGDSIAIIRPRDRIAQMVCTRSERVEFKVCASLPTSARDEGGFGSTGR